MRISVKKALLSMAAMALVLGAGVAEADTSGKKIALSNNYAGNSWRQSMLKSWDKVTKKAVADGVVAEATPFTTRQFDQVWGGGSGTWGLLMRCFAGISLSFHSS